MKLIIFRSGTISLQQVGNYFIKLRKSTPKEEFTIIIKVIIKLDRYISLYIVNKNIF